MTEETMVSEVNFAEALTNASGPLSFTYWLSPSVSVVTNVFGDARNQAGVTIYNGSMAVWMGSMNQVSPIAVVEQTLILGSMSIKQGATFKLTIPTQQQMGNMFMTAEIQSSPNPWQQFAGIIASWTLTS